MLIDEIEKEPFDEFGVAVRYQQVLRQGEYPSTCTLAATRLSDSVDVTATFLASATATIPSSTATAGSTTSIKSASNLVTVGFKVGDYFVNQTKGYMALIKEIQFASAINDTLVFPEQAIAAAAADAFSAAKAIASIKAGSDGERISVIFSMTTNLGAKFQDELIIRVKDY